MMRLSELIGVPRGITAVVGSGGKTSLISRLARELSETHRVLIATTTHIWPPDCRILLSPSFAEIQAGFQTVNLLAVGTPTGEGKLGPVETLQDNYAELADYVLVEADGARGLSLKAPAEHEPVLPPNAALTIGVAGMNCYGKTIGEAAHRPAIYASIAGKPLHALVTPETAAKVLTHPLGQRKGVIGRYLVALNQVDTVEKLKFARAVAARIVDEDTVLMALMTRPGFFEYYQNGKRR